MRLHTQQHEVCQATPYLLMPCRTGHMQTSTDNKYLASMPNTQQKHTASLCIPRGCAIIPHTRQRLSSHSSWAQFCLWSDSFTSSLHANWHESYLAVLRLNELSWEGSKSSLSLKQTDRTLCFTKITPAKFLFSIYNKAAVSPTEQQIKKEKSLYLQESCS